MKQLKFLSQRFRGGPNFSNCSHLNAIMEDVQLNVELPNSNIASVEKPRNINYPFNQHGWFEQNAKWNRQHYYVPIDTQLWYYLPKGFFANMIGELGVLSLSIQLKRIEPQIKINAFELQELGKYLLTEYDEFYNSPVIGDSFLGENNRIIKETTQELKENTGFDDEKIELYVKAALEGRGYPPIPAFEILSIQEDEWVYYTEPLNHGFIKKMFCKPLSDQFYLNMLFKYRIDIDNKFKLWKANADAAVGQIMQSVEVKKLTRI